MLLLVPQRTACPWQHNSPDTVEWYDTGACTDVNSPPLCDQTRRYILTTILWQFLELFISQNVSYSGRQHNLLMHFSCHMCRIKSHWNARDKMTLWHWPLLATKQHCIWKGQRWHWMFLYLSSFSAYCGAELSQRLVFIWNASKG